MEHKSSVHLMLKHLNTAAQDKNSSAKTSYKNPLTEKLYASLSMTSQTSAHRRPYELA